MAESFRREFDQVQRKTDAVAPEAYEAQELAGKLLGAPDAVVEIERYLEQHPGLWNMAPAEMMRELQRLLPGVGKGVACAYVYLELYVGRRIQGRAPASPAGEQVAA